MIAAGATNQGTAGMADDVLEDAGPAPDAGKAKRAPPTIDLEATKVSETATESRAADADPVQAEATRTLASPTLASPTARPSHRIRRTRNRPGRTPLRPVLLLFRVLSLPG